MALRDLSPTTLTSTSTSTPCEIKNVAYSNWEIPWKFHRDKATAKGRTVNNTGLHNSEEIVGYRKHNKTFYVYTVCNHPSDLYGHCQPVGQERQTLKEVKRKKRFRMKNILHRSSRDGGSRVHLERE